MKKLALLLCISLMLGFSASCTKQKDTKKIISAQSQNVLSSAVSSAVSSETVSSEEPVVGFNANISGVPVLLYHHFRVDKKYSDNVITTPQSEFEEHLKALKTAGYRSLSMQDLIDFIKTGKKIPPKSVMLTFDDGYKSNVTIAAPILRKYGYTGIVFVITGLIDEKNELFDENPHRLQYVSRQDMESSKDVFEFACHSHMTDHINMTTLSTEKQLQDLATCKSIINSPYFSYPLGKYDTRYRNSVKNSGFSLAFTTAPTHVKTGIDLFQIPRYTIVFPMSAQKVLNTVENLKK